MGTLLPPSEPADPVQGQPGHFAWSNWIKQAVKNLDAGTLHTHEVAGRNRIINGDFSVNQRGFTTTTANAFGPDRWQGAGAGGSRTFSIQTAPNGELPESANNYVRFVFSGQSAAADYVLLTENIENVRTLSGKTVTVSFWAKSSGALKIGVEITQQFGTGGSPSTYVSIPAGAITTTTSWVRYSLTFAVPSIAGKTIGTGNDHFIGLNLHLSGGSNYTVRHSNIGIQSGTIDIWGVQLEEGTVASNFEQKHQFQELRDCQRYFTRFFNTGYGTIPIANGSAGSATNAYVQYRFPVIMRAMPTLNIYGSFFASDRVANFPVTGITMMNTPGAIQFPSEIADLNVTATGSMVIRSPIVLMGQDLNAYITFFAEL